MKSVLITGTDTEVGKTIITTALRAFYQKYFISINTGLMKLLQTGEEGDQEFYKQYFDDVVVPLRFSAPLAPPLAADLEKKAINLELIKQNLRKLQQTKDLVLVEALGGLGSPITHELTIADLAQSWNLEIILVVPVKLGAIAQTVANVALARSKKITIKGIIFNCNQPCTTEQKNNWTPVNLIESFTDVPVLGYFPYLEKIENLEELAKITAQSLNFTL